MIGRRCPQHGRAQLVILLHSVIENVPHTSQELFPTYIIPAQNPVSMMGFILADRRLLQLIDSEIISEEIHFRVLLTPLVVGVTELLRQGRWVIAGVGPFEKSPHCRCGVIR